MHGTGDTPVEFEGFEDQGRLHLPVARNRDPSGPEPFVVGHVHDFPVHDAGAAHAVAHPTENDLYLIGVWVSYPLHGLYDRKTDPRAIINRGFVIVSSCDDDFPVH